MNYASAVFSVKIIIRRAIPALSILFADVAAGFPACRRATLPTRRTKPHVSPKKPLNTSWRSVTQATDSTRNGCQPNSAANSRLRDVARDMRSNGCVNHRLRRHFQGGRRFSADQPKN